jgi:cytoskeletal protein RodZ
MDKSKVTPPVAKANQHSFATIRKNFGQMMSSAREVTCLSIEQVSEITRISKPFIESLESGELQSLPGFVFGRGFIRNLCKAYGIEPHDYLEAFELAANGESPLEDEHNLSVHANETVLGVKLRSEIGRDGDWKGFVVSKITQLIQAKNGPVGIFLIAALGVPLLFWLAAGPSQNTTVQDIQETFTEQNRVLSSTASTTGIPTDALQKTPPKNTDIQKDTAQKPSKKVPSVAEGKSVLQPDLKPQITETAKSIDLPETKPKTLAQNSAQVLEVTVKEPVRIRINMDKASWQTKRLTPGVYEFRFNYDTQLLVFDAAALSIRFNGKSLGSLGTKGRVRRLSFVANTAQNSKLNNKL